MGTNCFHFAVQNNLNICQWITSRSLISDYVIHWPQTIKRALLFCSDVNVDADDDDEGAGFAQ